MITVVIPSYNRAYTLRYTLPTYYEQELVDELIVVNDGNNDETRQVVEEFELRYPNVRTIHIPIHQRKGASAARNTGARAATNEFVLFGDDDALLSDSYARSLYKKLIADRSLAGVAGRWVQMLPGETPSVAMARFGIGFVNKPAFCKYSLLLNAEAYFKEDQRLPMAPPTVLTTKKLLMEYPFDERYCKGNGYREETTFQAAAYAQGYDFLLTNDVHCYHMAKDNVKKGGQRTGMFLNYFWCLYFNKLFLNQFYPYYKQRMRLRGPQIVAELTFSIHQFIVSIARPLGSLWIKKPLIKLWNRLRT
ncbi:MAG: hypothetical protein Tsb0021_08870 [Chlamydiales bacterium]